jgi:hypothetical protein
MSVYFFPQDSKRAAEVERLRKIFLELKEWSAQLEENGERLQQKRASRDGILVSVYFFTEFYYLCVILIFNWQRYCNH